MGAELTISFKFSLKREIAIFFGTPDVRYWKENFTVSFLQILHKFEIL